MKRSDVIAIVLVAFFLWAVIILAFLAATAGGER